MCIRCQGMPAATQSLHVLFFSLFFYSICQPETFLLGAVTARVGPVDFGAGNGFEFLSLPSTSSPVIAPALRLLPILKPTLVRRLHGERFRAFPNCATFSVPTALSFLAPTPFLLASHIPNMRKTFATLNGSRGTILSDAQAGLQSHSRRHCTTGILSETTAPSLSFQASDRKKAANTERSEDLVFWRSEMPKRRMAFLPLSSPARLGGCCCARHLAMGKVVGFPLGALPAVRSSVCMHALRTHVSQKHRDSPVSENSFSSEPSAAPMTAGPISSVPWLHGWSRTLQGGHSSRAADSLRLNSSTKGLHCLTHSRMRPSASSVQSSGRCPSPYSRHSPAGGSCLSFAVSRAHASTATRTSECALAASLPRDPLPESSASSWSSYSSSSPSPSPSSPSVSAGCSSCLSPCHLRLPLEPPAPESETVQVDKDGETQRPLVTPRMHARMEKQGYKVVGTHSAVKLCRWTKKQLQGLGGCYKHTFYGIESHRCMEATTSIACSNRCIFCWRHHTHPASKTFSWQVDPPEFVLKHALEAHWSLIKPLRGVHWVTPEAFAEAKEPRHCALSLIGEALMYPRINEFIDLLHAKGISSFLVMNGQHPDRLADLTTVTQLYVSVDAPNKKDLKAIDRPLFTDYWERLLASLEILREKRERTVLRMTLIKSVNDADLEGYARLVELGRPNFIEIKGVTFAGHSPNFKLSLGNTPHMQETLEFSRKLLRVLNAHDTTSAASLERLGSSDDYAMPMYRLASIHEHTNAVLLADARLFLLPPEIPTGSETNHKSRSQVTSEDHNRSGGSKGNPAGMEFENGACEERDGGSPTAEPDGPPDSRDSMRWHTHIDFKKFFELNKEDRHARNYRSETPSWALPDAPLRGFDPRFDVHKYVKQIAGRPHSLPEVQKQDAVFPDTGTHAQTQPKCN
ncbi:radical SAM domain-containing protein [Toxoplasma gondii MAS]|uniref:Radical SAM domain-containing protein n=1 Tax=Toxoplasma gondii MAS TaxID=943118 RepID=A0A086R077_TOXGO|nr:radical SAM domain-containing protein [Toxoplasma gondii MAS]